jgi:hypothetical protein
MPFFYVLINGVSWKIASKLINKPNKFGTINRRYNEWVKMSLIHDTYESILNNYKLNNPIIESYIDSTDIMNANCNDKCIGKSIKLKKQATKLSFICDQNKVPISKYQLDEPKLHDSKAGFEVIIQMDVLNNKQTYLAGDKGYIVDKETRVQLLNLKGIKLIYPKKKYTKKKIIKQKIINRKEKEFVILNR